MEFILLENMVNFPFFSPFVSTENINSITLLSYGFILVYVWLNTSPLSIFNFIWNSNSLLEWFVALTFKASFFLICLLLSTNQTESIVKFPSLSEEYFRRFIWSFSTKLLLLRSKELSWRSVNQKCIYYVSFKLFLLNINNFRIS